MGYAQQTGENFSSGFFPGVGGAGARTRGPWRVDAENCSSGELSLISDFLQDVGASLFRLPVPRQGALESQCAESAMS